MLLALNMLDGCLVWDSDVNVPLWVGPAETAETAMATKAATGAAKCILIVFVKFCGKDFGCLMMGELRSSRRVCRGIYNFEVQRIFSLRTVSHPQNSIHLI